MEPIVVCRACGHRNDQQDKECRACGKRLFTFDPTLESGVEVATTTPSGSTASETFPSGSERTEQGRMAVDSTDVPIEAAGVRRRDTPAHKLIGTLVGEYRVTRLIGEGGMGTVFAGKHPLIGKDVAIKVLKRSLSDDADVVERFLAEAKAVNTIGHPNIIDIFAFGTLEDESQYFVMEYLAGQSLAEYLDGIATVAWADGLAILRPVLEALIAAHQHGVVHRDLKPDNIFLMEHPSGGWRVKLLDFGIAKFTEEGITSGHTRTGVPIGTPRYMSPEQCYGRDVDHHADIYSLGVIMYQMFTGQPPFSAKSVYQLVECHVHTPPVKPSSLVKFPAELEEIILRCLAKDKAERHDTVAELADAVLPVLEQLAARDTVAPVPMPKLAPSMGRADTDPEPPALDSRPQPAPEESPRRGGLYATLAVVCVAVIGAAWLVFRPSGSPSGEQQPSAPPPTMAPERPRPMRPKADLVTLQFHVSPSGVKHTIYVDGERVPGRLFEVPRHRSRAVKVKIVASGYETYEADWIPVSNLPIQVTLVAKSRPRPADAMRRVPPRRRPWRRPPVRRDPRPMTRPTMGGFDML